MICIKKHVFVKKKVFIIEQNMGLRLRTSVEMTVHGVETQSLTGEKKKKNCWRNDL